MPPSMSYGQKAARTVNLDIKYTNTCSILGYTDDTEEDERKGMAMDLFDSGAVLFASEENEEGLTVECHMMPGGEFRIVQESAGPLTKWSFGESPHTIEVTVGPSGVDAVSYTHLTLPTKA